MGSELVVNMEANQVILAPPNNDLDNKSALSEKGIMIYYQTTVREIYNNILSKFCQRKVQGCHGVRYVRYVR